MPEAPATVAETPAHGSDNGSAAGPVTGCRNQANGQFTEGNTFGQGRPKGSRNAAKALDRAAPKLARHMILRSFKSDSVLCKTMDKLLPDAGRTDTLISVRLTRDEVLAEIQRRGLALPPTVADADA